MKGEKFSVHDSRHFHELVGRIQTIFSGYAGELIITRSKEFGWGA